ncbi:MAG: hypothetical protein JNL11_20645 [Bdellovibrionaceae bacterium]|nr:hypothetical protein [Pseudobdellovibrionaceae bacterium]
MKLTAIIVTTLLSVSSTYAVPLSAEDIVYMKRVFSEDPVIQSAIQDLKSSGYQSHTSPTVTLIRTETGPFGRYARSVLVSESYVRHQVYYSDESISAIITIPSIGSPIVKLAKIEAQ